jgi:DNA/RNA endonuclease G (NUC1)
MKYLLIFLFLIPLTIFGQRIDTIINNGHYTSYYSYTLKQPHYVIYKLYKGGGNCDRRGMTFKSGGVKFSPTFKDYSKSGYDQGHLVSFEDYAYDCIKAESTFRYYNAVPQTPDLNRGVWKMYEHIIRQVSQNDSLLIITGGSDYRKKIGSVYVPEYCWKVVYSLSKKVVIYALFFKNDQNDAWVTDETITTLEQKIGYNIRKYLQ